jgi:hypothetical protein
MDERVRHQADQVGCERDGQGGREARDDDGHVAPQAKCLQCVIHRPTHQPAARRHHMSERRIAGGGNLTRGEGVAVPYHADETILE